MRNGIIPCQAIYDLSIPGHKHRDFLLTFIMKEFPTFDFFRFDSQKMVDVSLVSNHEILNHLKVYMPHKLDFHLIRIIKKGRGIIYRNYIPFPFEERYVITSTPGDILFVDYDNELDFEIYLIAFSDAFLDYLSIDSEMLDFTSSIFSDEILKFEGKDFSTIMKLTELIAEENSLNPGGVKDRMLAKLVESLLYFLVRDIRKSRLKTDVSRNYLNVYKDYLNLITKHINNRHFVADYVDLMHINEKKLNRVCKKATGLTALQIIHKQINDEIKRQLFYTSLSNKEIAQKLGFNDAAHFYKFFRKWNGMTPKEFQKNIQKIW